jgi:Fic family protein
MSAQVTLGQIDKLKRELDALRPLKSEAEEKLWKKLRLEWNYNSNHIEGNTLTYGETELLLIFDKTTGDHTKREYDEMQAHDVAIKMVQELAADNEHPLTEVFIRRLNETILVKPYWKNAETPDRQETRREIKIGEYKSFPNSVRLANGEMFHYAMPEETPALMHDLMQWHQDSQHLHPAELAALFHYKFVRIHPFDDGNGRVARLVMNYILMKAGYVPIVIKSKDKAQYIDALNKADVGELNKFVEYIQNLLPWSFNIAIKAAKGEDLEERDDIDKEIDLLKRKVFINKKINKSPKLVYDIFDNINGSVWTEVNKVLNQFDSFFNEKKINHFVNGTEEQFEIKRKNVFESPFIREESTAPRPFKIFGFEIYETDIKEIEWFVIMYGLKGAAKVINYEINLGLDFLPNQYIVKISINYKTAYEVTNAYNDRINKQEIDEIIINVKKFMVDSINKNLEGTGK